MPEREVLSIPYVTAVAIYQMLDTPLMQNHFLGFLVLLGGP